MGKDSAEAMEVAEDLEVRDSEEVALEVVEDLVVKDSGEDMEDLDVKSILIFPNKKIVLTNLK